MSDNPEEKDWRDITPKPRRPLHCEMGRYGMNTVNANRHESPKHTDHGKHGSDEVDNVMSKMVHRTSPLPLSKRTIHRSYSSDNNDEYSEDNDNTNMLSKSLPATLPSHLYSSDNSDLESDELSYSRTQLRDDNSQYSRNISDSQQSSPYKQTPYVSRTEGPQNKNIGIYIMLALVISLIAISWQFFDVAISTQNKTTQTENYDELVFEHNMDHLKEKYNIDHNSILKIKTGISTIFSRMDAGSFMFLYDSKTDNFDPLRFDKFINEVAHTAARYLRNNITPVQHTVVVSSSLDMIEHGELISKYRDDVDKTGVMLVKEIDAVPSDLAMAFHYYCDEYDPLVKRSAIFFTLNLANCSNTAVSDKKSTHDFIEKCLARKWKSVPQENIRPLLTRIVDIIIDVTRVF